MAKKQCTTCFKYKNLSYFYSSKSKKGGYQSECKFCMCLRRKEYIHTMLGLLGQIYTNQKCNSKKRNHTPPNYSLKKFRTWALSKKEFHVLYEHWVKSDYQKAVTPSADRMDDYKPYTFSNLRWGTWQENNEKHYADRKNGINNKHSKYITQLSVSGGCIKEFYSIREAERQLKVDHSSIIRCCSGKQKTAGGFKWIYTG